MNKIVKYKNQNPSAFNKTYMYYISKVRTMLSGKCHIKKKFLEERS